MSPLKLFGISIPFITLVLLLLLQPGHDGSGAWHGDPRAYVERGNQVENRYAAYSKRLARHHAALVAVVKEHAPDLLAPLQPREPLRYGYRILPRILPAARAETPTPTSPVAYSWPWTDRLIDDQLRAISRSEADLRRSAAKNFVERRAILQRLTLDYAQQSRRLQNIYAHLQYNRFWQGAIAADRSGYDRQTMLQTKILERQQLVRRLKPVHKTAGPADSLVNGGGMTGALKDREALLTRRIDQAIGGIQTPGFIKIQKSDGEWTFRLPLFTDIEDRDYVTAVKNIIEDTWQLIDGKNRYRVAIDVAHVSARDLYGDNPAPKRGDRLDVSDHLKRFPAGGAVLTTGALTTHVQNHAIILGPHPIAPRVLAHEFGHILGFRDLYVRGYSNLGENGFQVLEVVADPADIMASTAQGRVLHSHFIQLVNQSTSLPIPVETMRKIIDGPRSGPSRQSRVRRILSRSQLDLMLAAARRGDDRNDHYGEHAQAHEQSDRGVHAQNLSARRSRGSGRTARSRFSRRSRGSRSAFRSRTRPILGFSTLHPDIEVAISCFTFDSRLPFILLRILRTGNLGEAEREE